MSTSYFEAMQAPPVRNSTKFFMGIEVGIQAVSKEGGVHLDPVLKDLQEDPDFLNGFLKGMCQELMRQASKLGKHTRLRIHFVKNGRETRGRKRIWVEELIPSDPDVVVNTGRHVPWWSEPDGTRPMRVPTRAPWARIMSMQARAAQLQET